MWVMYDSTTLGAIPADAPAVAGYVGGEWPTYRELKRRWPRAQHLSIAVNAGEDADCLDIENGDATPADAPAWHHRQVARGIVRPVLYASLSKLGEVMRELEQAGIHRDEYRLFSAHYVGLPHICGPACGAPTRCDATQWEDAALGRNLDESLCASDFFRPVTPARLYKPADEARWEHEYDQLGHHQGPWARTRRRALQRRMGNRTLEILTRVRDDPRGWDKLNREKRYAALIARL